MYDCVCLIQVIERHLYLMLLEVLVFLLVLACCLGRQEKRYHRLLLTGTGHATAERRNSAPARNPSSLQTPCHVENIPSHRWDEDFDDHESIPWVVKEFGTKKGRDRSGSSPATLDNADLSQSLDKRKSGKYRITAVDFKFL